MACLFANTKLNTPNYLEDNKAPFFEPPLIRLPTKLYWANTHIDSTFGLLAAMKLYTFPLCLAVAALVGAPRTYAHICDGAEVEQYIRDYGHLAAAEQYRTGISAGVTLAQAMLESNFGKSELALYANNHFGLKCKSSWTGQCYTKASKEQDKTTLAVHVVESKFRAYASVEESYADRANYLASEARYKHLFNLASTDYVAWAKGLQEAGYATDVNYAKKLIQFIEQHQLQRFDVLVDNPTLWADVTHTQLTTSDVNRHNSDLQVRVQRLERIATSAELERSDMRTELGELRKQLHQNKIAHENEIAALKARIADLEQALAQQEIYSAQLHSKVKQIESVQQSILRTDPLQRYFTEDGTARQQMEIFPVRKKNAEGIFFQSGKRATSLPEGKTLMSIAVDFQIEYRDLLAFNELAAEDVDKLPKGCYIYLEPKASNCTEMTNRQHQVAAGETMQTISQLYGVKVAKLYQRNYLSLEKGEQPAIGEFIFINDKAPARPRLKEENRPNNTNTNIKFGKGGTN